MFFLPFVVSFFAALLTAPIVIWIYRRAGWVETPDVNNPKTTHTYPVPRGGGIPIFLSIFCAMIFFVAPEKRIVGILAGAFVLTIVGILDDRFNLNPYLRLLLLFAAAALAVASGVGIPFLTVPFFGIVHLDDPKITLSLFGAVRHIWIIADIFALVWIVALANFVNWSKGVDGQLPGVVAVSALTIGALSLRFAGDAMQQATAVLSLITAGAYLGFLPWNFYPQKMMPGFGGGTLGGYFLAVMSILSTAKVGTLLVVLGIPLIDASYTIARRLLSGRSPVWGDRGHLHHHLLDDLHWSKRQIAFFYWLTTAILGIIALQLNSQQKFYTMVGVVLGVGGTLLWLTQFGQSSKQRVRNGG